MPHYRSLEEIHLNNTWLTIGSFDGVHLGHQAIVKGLAQGAHEAGSQAIVLTFYPHPAVVLGKHKDPFYLTTSDERADLLQAYGADIVITYPFDREVAATSASDFMAKLKAHLGLAHLLVGPDFAMGRNREGNVPTLRKLGDVFGYTLEIMPPVEVGGEVVSSSRIRAFLAEGEVGPAAGLLGRPYRISGRVVTGDGRGRSIGIPTANLEVWAERSLPKAGVYVCHAIIDGKSWRSVTNVGYRPTFESEPLSPRVETHILDFLDPIYGQQIQLDFLARLRDEQRFPSVEALVEQIHRDIRKTREYFANTEKIE